MNAVQECFYPLNENNLSKLVDKISEIVNSAGERLTQEHQPEVREKGHADYVTDMDIRIQKELVSHLKGLLPHASFILEEQDIHPEPGEYTWVIDPIDGTQNYINNYHQSAICVALLHNLTGICGIVYNPYYKELFVGIKGNGAYLNGKPIKTSNKALMDAVICYGTSPYRKDLKERSVKTFQDLYGVCADFRRSGSAALDLCAVACGRADGFFEYSLCPWDYSAASIILREAGAQIAHINCTDWNYTRSGGIIAGNSKVFAPLKNIVEAEG